MIHVAVVRTGHIFVSVHTHATNLFFCTQEHGSSISLSGDKNQWTFREASIGLQLYNNELSCFYYLLKMCTVQVDSKHDIWGPHSSTAKDILVWDVAQFQKGERMRTLWRNAVLSSSGSSNQRSYSAWTAWPRISRHFNPSQHQRYLSSNKASHHISAEDAHLLIHKILQVAWCHFNMTLYPYLDSVQKLLWVIFSSVGSHLYQIHQPARITTSYSYICISRCHITSSTGQILSSCIHQLPQQPVPSDPPSS